MRDVKVSWSRLIHVDDGDSALKSLSMRDPKSTRRLLRVCRSDQGTKVFFVNSLLLIPKGSI